MDYCNTKRRKTFVLDTKSTCFLCLQQIFSPDADNNDEDNRKCDRFSLHSILVYLRLNPRKVFCKLSTGPLKNTLKLLKEITNFSVSLCEECRNVCESLSELCRELEQIRMKVDHFLESFYELLAYSENDVGHLERFRGMMNTGPLEMIQRKIAETLRKEAKDKCGVRLNSAKPRVEVKRIDDSFKLKLSTFPPPANHSIPQQSKQPVVIPIVTSPIIFKLPPVPSGQPAPVPPQTGPPPSSLVSFSQHTCDPCGGQFPSKEEWVNHLKINCLLSGGSTSKRPPPPTSTHFPRQIIPRPLNDPFKCPHCINGSFKSNFTLSRHQAHLHSEQFFLSSKQPHVSEKTFKSDCEQLLHTLVTLSKLKTTDAGGIGKESFKCVYCLDSKITSGWTNFYIHLVKAHPDIVTTKLVVLQEKRYGLSQEQPYPSPPPPANISQKSVEYFTTTWIKSRGLAFAQVAQTRVQKVKPPSSLWKCDICGKGYNLQISLNRHRARKHSGVDASSVSSSSTASSITTNVEEREEDGSMFEETEVYPFVTRVVSLKRESIEEMEVEEETEIYHDGDLYPEKGTETTEELETGADQQDKSFVFGETEIEEAEEEEEEGGDGNEYVTDLNLNNDDDPLQMWVNGDLLQ